MEAAAEQSQQESVIGGLMGKFGLEMNARNGMIIAVAIVLILYMIYAYAYPKFFSQGSAEGVTSGSKKNKKNKSSGSDSENDNSEEIGDLVNKIENKQNKNLAK